VRQTLKGGGARDWTGNEGYTQKQSATGSIRKKNQGKEGKSGRKRVNIEPITLRRQLTVYGGRPTL